MIKVAVGIIKDKNGRVLLCRRPEGKPYPLQWEFPGGKLEPGESAEHCLLRELREELGIQAVIGEIFHRQQYVYPDSGHFDVVYYFVNSFSGTLSNNGFAEVCWVPVAGLSGYDILEDNREVVERLTEHG
jgi:8-oxo-dGTP diphosphatase